MTNTQIQGRYASALFAWIIYAGVSGASDAIGRPWDDDSPTPLRLALALIAYAASVIAVAVAIVLAIKAWNSPDVVDAPQPAEKTLTPEEAAAAVQVAIGKATKTLDEMNTAVAALMLSEHTDDITRRTDPASR